MQLKQYLRKCRKDLRCIKLSSKHKKNKEVLKLKIIGRLENPSGIKPNQKWFAVGYYDGYQVLIPSDTLCLDNLEGVINENGNSVSDYVKEQMYRACIGAMIGSEISFVIRDSPNALNPELKLIVGVRVRKM